MEMIPGKSARILIAEDDSAINQLICRILEKEGYAVTQAFSGTEAKLRLEMQEFDLLVLDLMMPGMDGETLLEKVQEENREKNKMLPPVLVLSAKSALSDKVKLLTSGADDYMTKPFEPEELTARVFALLRRAGRIAAALPGDAGILVHKNLRLAPEARKVTVNGQELELTRHEYEILHILMQSPDKVFSRETLYEKVWSGGYYGEDNTVNVHISNLRKKLAAKDARTEYIRTVWGIGFKMSETL